MKVFSVCGIKNSGKTTTIENIIAELTARGYKVGSTKYIHCEGFEMDKDPEVDTRRHRAAGSSLICARAKTETSLLFSEKLSMEQILSIYQFMGTFDWVVLEGAYDIDLPTIVTAHEEADLLEKLNDRVFCISGVISANLKNYKDIPVIDSTKDIKALVDTIEHALI
ncbi:MAG: molybdopterin-guanine dinucleotide biosynthesis protein B [Defluviitaleaceae bacterium]|nr:molybdopterin-guanine dinucleotide biosynthesis protein B [Defluviitaleaceae bacterium]